MYPLDPVTHFFFVQADELLHTHLRDRITLPSSRDKNCGHDRERQWNPDLDRCPKLRLALNAHFAADFLDVCLYDVHTHAAAREARYFLGGRETRKKNELNSFLIIDRPRLLGRDESALEALALQQGWIHSRAIVR